MWMRVLFEQYVARMYKSDDCIMCFFKNRKSRVRIVFDYFYRFLCRYIISHVHHVDARRHYIFCRNVAEFE